MNEETESTPAPKPRIQRAQRWNMVWVVPMVALLLGVWLLYRHFSTSGPVAQVTFETADGISAGKTEVRCRSVKVGIVKDVKLSDDLDSVVVHCEFDPDVSDLLREGTRFWVVRPRLTASEISGVGTLITGAYIELDPGPEGGPRATDFTGLELPPATNSSVPGRRIILTADQTGSLVVGSPIYHRGFEVGRVEARRLDSRGKRVEFDAFIQQDYAFLVRDNTRFWNTSGINLSADSSGFKLHTPSLQAMISGGVTFGVPRGLDRGEEVPDGTKFVLYDDEEAAEHSTFNPTLTYLLLFDQSVRGLADNAPVEFRGITIGRVAEISFELVKEADESRIPVLIEIDPTLMRPETAAEMVKSESMFLRDEVAKGMRASLKTGSFITGALFVDLDYYPDASVATLGQSAGFTTIPTVSAGLAQLEAKLTAILDKIQALPIETTMQDIAEAAKEAKTTIADAREALQEIENAAVAAEKVLADPEFKELPADLRVTLEELKKSVASVGPDGAVQGDLLRTLDELRASLRSLKSMTNTIDEKPNSLLFGRESSGNPIPKAPRAKR